VRRVAILKPILLAIALATTASSLGFAGEIVVPAKYATKPVDRGHNSYPFDGDHATRTHHVYRWRAFGLRPRVITGVAFRAAVYQDPIFYQCRVTIILSTTWRGPSSLSQAFDRNVGPDAIVVFSGSAILDHPVATPVLAPFETVIAFERAFTYRPGPFRNLLVEIRSQCLGSGEDPAIEKVEDVRMGIVAAIGSFADELTEGNRLPHFGLVTQFITSP